MLAVLGKGWQTSRCTEHCTQSNKEEKLEWAARLRHDTSLVNLVLIRRHEWTTATPWLSSGVRDAHMPPETVYARHSLKVPIA